MGGGEGGLVTVVIQTTQIKVEDSLSLRIQLRHPPNVYLKSLKIA